MFRGIAVFVPAGFRSDGRRLDDGAGFEALLLAAPPELSAEDLASGLQASRRSPSQATRILVQAGPIEHRRRRGERLFPGETGRLGRDDPAESNPWSADPLDPSLTLTRTQLPATVSSAGNRKPLIYAGSGAPRRG
jgi:hypothetical protein